MQTGFRTNFSWKRGFSMMLLTLFSFSVAVAQVLVRGTVVDQTGESVPPLNDFRTFTQCKETYQ